MYSTEQINTAESQLRGIIRQNRAATQQYENFMTEYKELDDILTSLPGKVRHPIMVPISSVAFMEGYIENSNELTVLLGDNYFVKCTSAHAKSILSRRVAFTQKKIEELQDEYKLISSRVGLARQWLEVDGEEDEEEVPDNAELPDLGLPKPTGPKPKIEVISSTEDTSEDIDAGELAQRRAKIKELEQSGIELTDEELAKMLGVSVPDFPSDTISSLDQGGLIEIQEYERPDGTVEAKLNPLKGITAKSGPIATPVMVQEHVAEEKVVLSPMLPQRDNEEREASPPKRVSKFKQLREQNRQ